VPGGLVCPSCGEQESLRGSPTSGGGIEVECLCCQTRWDRGSARCRSCGRAEAVVRPQVITRTPRGNQLAAIGYRQVPLCLRCDAEAVQVSVRANQPVPTTYLSRFLLGESPVSAPADHPCGDTAGPVVVSRRESAASAPARPQAELPARGTPPTAAAGRSVSGSTPTGVHPGGPVSPDPTVRQALEAFQRDVTDADLVTLLLLGQHLGPSRRLSTLEHPDTRPPLASWFDKTWGGQDSARQRRARDTLDAVSRHWREHRWVSVDLADG